MLASRLKWLIIPLALGLGAAGGVVGMRMMPPKTEEYESESAVSRGLDPVPPGFFDVSRLATKDDSGPPVIQPGQVLIVEVLEALPGRPITGERVVRPDGTISMGFYGDLHVAGLNRDQIKVKLVEHLRKYIKDEVLGLVVEKANGSVETISPVDTNRMYVDESTNYIRPAAKGGRNDTEVLNARIDELNDKLTQVLKELEQSRQKQLPARVPASEPAKPDAPAPTSTPG